MNKLARGYPVLGILINLDGFLELGERRESGCTFPTASEPPKFPRRLVIEKGRTNTLESTPSASYLYPMEPYPRQP